MVTWRLVAVVAAVVVVVGEAGAVFDPPPLVVPGDAVIGVVADLHSRGSDRGSDGGGCGAVQPRAVEQVVAAAWALDTINNQTQHDYTIGMRVYDSCGDEDAALRQTIRLLKDTAAPSSPLLGVVSLGSSRVVSGTATPLHAFRTPILITDARAARTATPTDNTFTTAPHLTDQLQAVLAAAVRVGGGVAGVSVVSSCAHGTEVLREQASRAGIRLLHVLQLGGGADLTKRMTHFINNNVSFGGVVVALLSAAELNAFTAEVDARALRKAGLRWVLSSIGGEPLAAELTEKGVRNKFSGSLLVESHSPVIPGFSQYFAEAILNKSSVAAPLAHQYMEAVAHCDAEVVGVPASPCVGREALAGAVRGSSTTATVKAVSSLAAAFRLVQIEKCSQGVRCLQALRHDLHQDVLKALLKLSFTVGDGADRIRYTADGRLVNSFSIVHITARGVHEVGTYREDTGVVWAPGEMITPEKVEKTRKGRTLGLVAEEMEQHRGVVRTVLLTHQDYIGRTWAFSVLVTACLGVVASLYVTVYVALRVCDGTLRGPQVLGAVLLLGVMGVFASCVVYVLPPGSITCAVRQWAPPLCLALCYGILLVKSMHLRALVTVGAEGEVSQLNLHISLLFIVGVQMALCMLGHAGGLSVGQDPLVKVEASGGRLCGMKPLATLATRVYLLFLLLLCLLLAAFNRKIQRNHNEGHWLLLTSCVSAPVVVVWAVMSYLAPPSLEAPTTSVALLILAIVILGLVFIPKMRVISQQAKKFRHKRLAAAASVSTVLSHLEDGSVRGLPQLQDSMKQLHNTSPHHSHQDSAGSVRSSVASQNNYRVAFSGVYGMPQPSPASTQNHALRSSIYDASKGAYP
ncbi:metabotropic glutamate receptor 5-like [Eriocheir sinensis]|uniref:metabotropic glutamate receptor 5-like n=1 Tax=Eriocheir sinensis TaxID=95602 RepID=UPI0021C82BB2|nr:metabotropic glutamate receptor 5-like [Eriocheir sinensis]